MIAWMGHAFTASDYIFWTRIQCSAWTLADLAIVFYLIRLANVARRELGIRRHSISLGVLLATVPPSIAVPFMTTGSSVFLLELAVTVPHFLLILYILTADARHFASALAALLREPTT
jgi:hypothetical protein